MPLFGRKRPVLATATVSPYILSAPSSSASSIASTDDSERERRLRWAEKMLDGFEFEVRIAQVRRPLPDPSN